MEMKCIILASQSPRRQELLGMLGYPFEIMVSEKEEVITSTNPAEVTKELSHQKAEAVAEQVDDGIVIGADTVVALDDKILGKPGDEKEAIEMIRSLQGRSHMVYTGVTILEKENGEIISSQVFAEGTKVNVGKMTEQEVEEYVASGDSYDKAGGYGIQGIFGKFIEGIEGDYFNVVGLPVHKVYEKMKEYI